MTPTVKMLCDYCGGFEVPLEEYHKAYPPRNPDVYWPREQPKECAYMHVFTPSLGGRERVDLNLCAWCFKSVLEKNLR